MIDGTALRRQRTFRILLQAMSHPGRVYQWGGERETPGADEPLCLMDIVETLLDGEVTFAVINDREGLARAIHEKTRSRPADVSAADFIIVGGETTKGEMRMAKRGVLEYPDDSATVIYCVHSCENREGSGSFALKGPGVKGRMNLAVHGFPADELSGIQEANSEFPFGIDVIFVDRTGRIACIPRSALIMKVS